MPNAKKEEMWNLVKTKFVFQKVDSDELINEETMEHVKTWALEDLSTKWRAWKNELKNKYYDEDKTPEQMFENVKDPRVNKDQFLFIAAHSLTTEAKEQSAKNRENRSKSDQPHCAGTKSFSRLIQTMTEENNGIPPSRADVYIRTRTRKDGNVVNDKAAEFVQRMKGIGIETSEDSVTQETSWKDDVFSKVVGPEKRSGHVRCSGIKSSLSNKSGPSSSQPTQQNQEVQGLKTEVQNLRTALKVVLNVLQRQFPDESEEMLNTITRVVNGETQDATSAPEISPVRNNNRSSESSHQPSLNQDNTPDNADA